MSPQTTHSTVTTSREQEAADRIVEFLIERNPEVTEIARDLDLIDSRLVDSLGFVSFVYLLEELTDTEIALDETTADDFRTIDNILARFFG